MVGIDVSSADSIHGRTSSQSKPPSPQPRGGIAIERILYHLMSFARDMSPDSISDNRLTSLQCRFVGK